QGSRRGHLHRLAHSGGQERHRRNSAGYRHAGAANIVSHICGGKIMLSNAPTAPASKWMLWGGYIVSAIPVLMLLFSGILKLVKPVSLVEEFARLGYGENLVLVIGILEIGCTVVYVIPR